jgi:hypothetical protein
MGAISLIICDVCGRDVAFSEIPLTNDQLRDIRERVDTMVSMNLKPHDAGCVCEICLAKRSLK